MRMYGRVGTGRAMTEPDRITWTQGQYAGWNGRPGTAKTVMFVISWRTGPNTPQWKLRTALPGMTSLEAASDDLDELKVKAERWLLIFAHRIGFAEERDKLEATP